LTLGPAQAAGSREASVEPVSATSTSPSTAARRRKLRAFATHWPTVAASFRQGIRMVSSVIRRPRAALLKKKVPRRVPFIKAKSRLLAAAGAGQIFRADGGAVGRQAAAPAVQGLARGGRHRGRG